MTETSNYGYNGLEKRLSDWYTELNANFEMFKTLHESLVRGTV